MPMDFGDYSSQSNESLEKFQLVSGLGEAEWLDLLGLNWRSYRMLRSGAKNLPASTLERIATYFKLEPSEIAEGQINFKAIQMDADRRRKWEAPPKYAVAQHGRARTTITSFDCISQSFGWRLRFDILKHLNMSELALTDEFAPVSMRFISDALEYLHARQFSQADFFAIGAYSFEANVNTIFGKLLSECASTSEVLEHMWGEYLQFLEKNCTYRFLKLNDEGATLEVKSNPEVASEMGVRVLGNTHICSLKAGMMASAPCYIGHPMAQVEETKCAHHGEPSCNFEIKFIKPPSANA